MGNCFISSHLLMESSVPYTRDEFVAQCNAMFAQEAERERLREFLRTPREKAMKAFALLPSSNIDPELHALRGREGTTPGPDTSNIPTAVTFILDACISKTRSRAHNRTERARDRRIRASPGWRLYNYGNGVLTPVLWLPLWPSTRSPRDE